MPFAALRVRDFRLYYIGVVASGFGTMFTQFATSWQMYEMTGSALQLGLLGLARFVPTVILLMVGGLLADAVDRRKLMIVTQAGQCAISATLMMLSINGQLSPNVFYVAALIFAVCSSLENPARQAIVPNLVPEHVLTNALALNATQRSASSIAGPALAGIVFGWLGPTANYVIDTVSWLVMIGALLVIRPVSHARSGRRAMTFKSLGEGFRYVWTHPILMAMMGLDFSQNLLGGVRTLLPVYAMDVLHIGPQETGFLQAATPIATLSTASLMSALPQVRRAGIGVMIGVGIFAVSTCIFAFNHNLIIAALCLAGQGIGDTVSHVFRQTILQLNIDDQIRGRVTSLNMVFTNGGPSLGQLRAGSFAQWLGPEMAVFTGGLAILAVITFVGFAIPIVRRFEIHQGDPVPVH
jgi:MFS family permease